MSPTPLGAQPRPRAVALLAALAALVVTCALAATVTYAVIALFRRPWDTVEGEVLFEAERIRRGLILYVDPTRGAFDYGPVPARFYVLYPPVWSWVLSHLPARVAGSAARAFDIVAWFGLLGWIAWRADPRCRRTAATAAAFAGSIFTLTLFAVTARPDTVALVFAGLALERTVRRGRIDVLAAGLFAVAPWMKPNVLGLAAGAFLANILSGRGSPAGNKWTPLAAAFGITGGIGLLLHLASGGAWITHLLRSTGQPVSPALWAEQLGSKLPVFGAPFAFAAWCGWRARAQPGVRLGLAALLASVAWASFSLAKIGSATNYCLEPAVASVVLLAHAPVPPLAAGRRALLAAAALAQALWCGVASLRSSYEEVFLRFPAEERALSRARTRCAAGPADVILGDETGIELALDGRIVATPFQMTHLARRGLYPLGAWVADVERPEVVGVVMEDDLLERPLSQVSLEHDRFGPELRRVLRDRFRLAAQDGDWFTYCR